MENNQIVQTPKENGGNKLILWLVGGLIIVIITVGGMYWYLGKQPVKDQASQTALPQASSQPQTTTESIDQELNTIDVQASDSDFDSIDQDLQSL